MNQSFTQDYPCRNDLYELLSKYIGHDNKFLPPFIYLYGHTGTGKTIIMKNVCNQQIGQNVSFIDCIECYTPKILYESIIDNLCGHSLTADNNYSSSVKCETACDFIHALKQLPKSTTTKNSSASSYILCFDNVERLRNIDANILPLFVKLQDISRLNICTIFIATISIEKMGIISEMSTITIYWPQYTKNELITILLKRIDSYRNSIRSFIRKNGSLNQLQIQEQCKMIDDSIDTVFLEQYLRLFIDMIFRINRDINELMLVSCEYFQIYCEPMLNGNVTVNDLQKLRMNFVQKFKSQHIKLYKRIDHHQPNKQISANSSASMNRIYSKQFELPYYTKYLLIAAYLASHIDAKSDKRLFMKNHGKQRKRKQAINAKAKVSEKLSTQIGAKSFSIDRLLAIFYAIMDEKVALTVTLMAQISSLVHLKLLCFVSGENNIMDGTAKLQCTVGLDFIREIGEKLHFDVCQYLNGFE